MNLMSMDFSGQRKRIKFSEGKSGSFMWFSPDNKYIIKTSNKSEANALKEIIIGYVKVI
jgi:hypothetical protein